MPRKAELLLQDILSSIRVIERASAGKTIADLDTDEVLRSVIYWNFSVIGEAMRRLREANEPAFERITDAHRIVGFRNLVVHGYDLIDHAITWRIVTDKLPVLRREVEAIQNTLP